jgi:hypothetical protein
MKVRQKQKRIIGPILATLLPMVLMALLPLSAGAVTLGDALDFSALSTAGDVNINNVAKVSVNALGDVGGQNVVLGNNSLAGGAAVADPGNITVGNYSKVKGECITDGGTVTLHTGAKCLSVDDTGTNAKLAVMSQAITDVGNFETALVATSPTQTLGAVTLASGKKATISDTVSGLNIIELPSVTLGNSSTLTLHGAPGDSMVLEITGTLTIGSGAKIVLAGGLPVDQVLIYVGGTVGSWGNSTSVGATLLAPNSVCAAGSGAKITGAIICGDSVTFLENATLTFNPSLVDIPGGGGTQPITLGNAKPFLLVSTGGNSKLGNVTLGNPATPNAGDIGGNSDILGSNSVIQGNVVAANNSSTGISVGNVTKVKQGCITGGSSVVLGSNASCASTDTTGTNPKLTTLAGAGPDASSFAAAVSGLTADQTIPAINIPASGHQTLTCTASPNRPPTTVVDTPSITMGGSSTLTIDCPAGTIMVINVDGSPGVLTLGPGFTIALTGGITADSVVFNVENISASPALLSGTSSTFNGTLIAAARGCSVKTGATINGQVVCGSDVTVGDNLTATYMPLVSIP